MATATTSPTLLTRGTLGYSKQQKELRAQTPPTVTPTQSISTTPAQQFNAAREQSKMGSPVSTGRGQFTNGVYSVKPTVSADKIGTVPPVNVPSAPVNTSYVGGTEFIGSTNASTQANATAQDARSLELQKLQMAKDSQKSDLITAMQQLGQETQMRDQAYIDTGVDTAKQQVDELSSMIEADQLSHRRQIEELDKNPGAMSSAGLQAAKNDLNSSAYSRQADLAIIQSAALRKYSTMKDIADRAVDAKMAPIKTALDIAEFFYEDNKADFTKEQDRMYQEKLKADERKYNKIEEEAKALSDAKLTAQQNAAQQNAPLSVHKAIQAAKTRAEVIAIGGKYAVDPLDRALKQAQLNKVNADIAKTRNDSRLASATATSTEAQSWADSISNGKAKLSDVPKNLKSSVVAAMNAKPANTQVINTLNDKLAVIKEITDNTGFFGGLRKTVGPNALARKGYLSFNTFTGKDQDLVASVNQLTNQETLTTLLDLKKAGGTLGALSEGEGRLLREAASKINTWKREDKDGNIYYKTSEASFLKEINTLKKYTERALKESGGANMVDTTDSYLDTVDASLSTINSPYGDLID